MSFQPASAPPSRPAKKKWMVISLVTVSLALIIIVFGEEMRNTSSLSGTMGSAATGTLEEVNATWSNEDEENPNHRNLDETFGVDVKAVNNTSEPHTASLTLFFSRDEEFREDADCEIDRQPMEIEPNGEAAIRFRSTARSVDCLDAGEWYAAVLSADGSWTRLEGVHFVEGGDAYLGIQLMEREAAPKGSLNLSLDVHRQVTDTGFDGLFEHPVDLWLQQGETLCLIASKTVSMPRDLSDSGSADWQVASVDLTLDLSEAKHVDTSGMETTPFSTTEEVFAGRECETCDQPRLEGSCPLSEGSVQVMAGPTNDGFRTVQEFYHHAPPTVVQTGTIHVEVREGETVYVTQTAYNPSIAPVFYTTESENDAEWILGMDEESLPSREPSEIVFRVSAAELEPGSYSNTVLVSAADYYGTQIELDVEVTVTPDSNVASEETPDPEIPSSLDLGNYPNPFNPTTTIRFQMPQRERATLVVYDIAGREVRVLHDGDLASGLQEFRFNAEDLPSGTYLYRLNAESFSTSKTMILVK